MLDEAVEALELVDHHVHGALRGELDRGGLEGMLTESDRPVPVWMTQFDSQLGFAVRRWCGPVLGLEPHASPETYLTARRNLGVAEVTGRLLAASGVGHYLLETGLRDDRLLDGPGMARASGRPVDEVVRLEAVLEDVALGGVTAAGLPEGFRTALAERAAGAVGLKSIVAYRHGLEFDPRRPSDAEVVAAAGPWLRAVEQSRTARVEDPVLLRFALWCAVDRGLPLQLHVGYGDPDLDLHRCDPLLLTGFIRAVEPFGCPLLLLHCYPFHRQAGYLAQVFPHVFLDVGLAVHHTGVRSEAVLAEALELAPFAKLLFSSDACGPPELHHLGARLWRRGMARVLGRWVAEGDWSSADAVRVARMVGRDNARRVYRLPQA